MRPPAEELPTNQDWHGDGEYDLDEAYAYSQFHGRRRDEVVEYFSEWPVGAVECLRFMPAIPFRYYVFALVDFLLSVKANENANAADAASCFLGLIEDKLNKEREVVAPIMEDLLPTVEYLAAHQNAFDADPAIYGSFSAKAALIGTLWREST